MRDGIPVSFPAIHVMGLPGDLSNAGEATVVVALNVVVVLLVVVDVVVVERLADDLPRMYFVRLKAFFSPLCLAWP